MRKILVPAMISMALVLQSGCATTATGKGTRGMPTTPMRSR
ncbi:hypothetical protein [Marinobacterium aestuariivivens]|uniref:Uncharacterized protein n=1 Tax=Marinobacterium aestuariivivens TaxID=1698799 RepID=A0ABW1ZY76_9GAMM